MASYRSATMSQSYALMVARNCNKNNSTKQSDENIELSYISQIHERHNMTNPSSKPKKKKYIRQTTTYGTF
jgi:hypothetical protein